MANEKGLRLSKLSNKDLVSDKVFDKFCNKFKIADTELKSFLRTWDGAGDVTSAFQAHLQKSTQGLTTFQRIAKSAGSVIKSLGASFASAAISMGVSFIASKAIEGISYAMNYSKTLADSAKGAGEAITQTNEDIDSYKEQIIDLQATLNDHSSTVEEVTSAKQQLLDIQSQLTEKYGSEASGIDLVNGSLERQLEITSTALTMPLFTDLLTSYTK